MAKFLVLWRTNPAAPRPSDPSEFLKQIEMMFAVIDDSIKKGEIEEFGFFLNGNSGYVIDKGEAVDTFRSASMFSPYILTEVHEIVPYETGKETLMALLKAQIATAK